MKKFKLDRDVNWVSAEDETMLSKIIASGVGAAMENIAEQAYASHWRPGKISVVMSPTVTDTPYKSEFIKVSNDSSNLVFVIDILAATREHVNYLIEPRVYSWEQDKKDYEKGLRQLITKLSKEVQRLQKEPTP